MSENSLCLVVLGAHGERKLFPLDKERVLIGRESECDIELPDQSVSKHHALVYTENSSAYIEDGVDGHLSQNGVYINGDEIKKPHPLKPGDELMIGIFRFSVRDTNEIGNIPTLEGVSTSPQLQTFLVSGDITQVDQDDLIARVMELSMTASEMERTFDSSLDRAMENNNLKRVAFLAKLKKQILSGSTKSGASKKERGEGNLGDNQTIPIVMGVGALIIVLMVLIMIFGS